MRRQCPKCKRALARVQRRATDRLLSRFFRKVHRYRCGHCNWEGNLGFDRRGLSRREQALVFLLLLVYSVVVGRIVIRIVDFLIPVFRYDTSE